MTSLPSEESVGLTIYVCPTCGAWEGGPGSRGGRKDWALWCDGACTHPKVRMDPVKVYREDVVFPLWEAAQQVYADSGEWKALGQPLREFPAPERWWVGT